jgi:hypothetical protein
MNYVAYYDNVLNPNYCKEIISKFEKNVEQQETTFLENHRSFTEINITKNSWTNIQNTLMNVMQKHKIKYMQQFDIDPMVWPDDLGYEQFRMKRYLPDGKDEFAFHVDVGNHSSAKRFLVFFWYLNTVEEGGETAFQINKKLPIETKIKPVVGRLLMFPPLWTHPHIGMKPISGPKYIIGGYLHYV